VIITLAAIATEFSGFTDTLASLRVALTAGTVALLCTVLAVVSRRTSFTQTKNTEQITISG